MTDYVYPYRDTMFALEHVVGFDAQYDSAGDGDINLELVGQILAEAGKFGSDVLAPLNVIGDQQGATLGENGVTETAGFKAAYQGFIESGWTSLTAEPEYEGQGLPHILGAATNEIWSTCNLAFSLCPLLSQGAMEALSHHGSDELKATWLPKLVSGEWTGTMNLTEPDAGSDLAAIKSKAIPDGDSYKISGQKIYITWGDHQMTDNIVHLVLARLPDAPAGVKGISLFLVPKFLLDANGAPTILNDVKTVGLEHKLGINASPTCTLSFGDNGGAVGYLIGEAHNGLAYMFTMMNRARQGVGVQGLAISERSYQQALQYAKDRLQGTKADGSRFAIIKYPDIRRMLMLMKSGIEAMRALALVSSAVLDQSISAGPADKVLAAKAELYTPIVKGWMTELAQELTYHGLQIHGGMGFIEETGTAQHYRDARILTIYEGTSGIQALDLIGRKTLLNGGEVLHSVYQEIAETTEQLQQAGGFDDEYKQLNEAFSQANFGLEWLLSGAATDKHLAGGASYNFMMLNGFLFGAWLLAKSALAAKGLLERQADDTFSKSKLMTFSFYCEHYLPRVKAYAEVMTAGSAATMALPEDMF